VITWADDTVESDQIQFINKNSFRITFTDALNKKSDFIFKKVVDEELKPDNP
jgi:hypothetical protein